MRSISTCIRGTEGLLHFSLRRLVFTGLLIDMFEYLKQDITTGSHSRLPPSLASIISDKVGLTKHREVIKNGATADYSLPKESRKMRKVATPLPYPDQGCSSISKSYSIFW